MVTHLEQYKIMIIEDNEDYANYIKMILKRVSDNYSFSLHQTMKDALLTLSKTPVDLVLMDLGLPDNDKGLEGIDQIHRVQSGVPIIILTTLDDDSIGIEAIKQGASDYLTKRVVDAQLLHRMILYSIERKHILDELEESKKKLLHVQKMESLVTLVGGIAHDFNNIITLIKGYSELITNNSESTQTIKKYSSQVHKASSRAAKLIEQLSTFSRVESSISETLQVDTFIKDSMKMFNQIVREDVSLHLSLQADSRYITINSSNLEQILLNLIVNAREAIPSTGKISIRSDILPGCPYCDEHEEVVEIEIEDSGTGIPDEDIPYIFDPYFTTKESGSGLGLATVYGLVHQAHGCLNVESTVGDGTVISLCFPSHKHTSSETTPTESSPVENLNSGTLLIIDDEIEILELLKNILTQEGYDVITQISAVKALEQLQQGEIDPDFIISDVVMPSMTGLEFADQIKEISLDVPIILMSGYSPQYYENIDNSVITLLRKPFTKDQILDVIQSLFNSS